MRLAAVLAVVVSIVVALSPRPAPAQSSRLLLPIDFVHSAEFGWLRKPVHASRVLDDMTQPGAWKLTGTGQLSFPSTPGLGGMRTLRVDIQLFRGTKAPTASGLSTVNLRRSEERRVG